MNLLRLTKSLLGLVALSLSLAASAQTTKQERPSFTATLTSFQTYVPTSPGNQHYMAAVVHFQNKTKQPLILGYSSKGFSATDEQGNRYGVTTIRGMGEASTSNLDAKFVLPAEGGSDMFVELYWRGPRNDIFGVTFDLNMAVRDLKKLEGNQYQIGPETTLEFNGLKTGYVATPEKPSDLTDHLVNAGPFKAQITRSKFGKSGRWQMIVDLTMKLENSSDRPMILACEPNTIFGNDSEGNVFGRGSASSTNISSSGIGLTSSGKADPQFVLAPGESKEVHFTIARAEKLVPGKTFTFYVALEELEILPSKQIREVRQYSLAFPLINER